MEIEKADKIKQLLISKVIRNPDIVFSDEIRSGAGSGIDLLSLIASLCNLLIEKTTGQDYGYFYHWANKVGGWVEDEYIEQLLREEANNDKRGSEEV